jgi:hypothetical protein
MKSTARTIDEYNQQLPEEFGALSDKLQNLINTELPQATYKLWHGHPVWFLDNNPTVGYSLQKKGVRLMFWSGADFDEPELQPGTGKFKDASVFYNSLEEIDPHEVKRWCEKAQKIQYNYRNIIRNKGELRPLN